MGSSLVDQHFNQMLLILNNDCEKHQGHEIDNTTRDRLSANLLN